MSTNEEECEHAITMRELPPPFHDSGSVTPNLHAKSLAHSSIHTYKHSYIKDKTHKCMKVRYIYTYRNIERKRERAAKPAWLVCGLEKAIRSWQRARSVWWATMEIDRGRNCTYTYTYTLEDCREEKRERASSIERQLHVHSCRQTHNNGMK